MATLTGTIHGVTEVNQQKYYLVAPLATSTASLAEKEVLLWWRNSSTAVRMSMSQPLAFQLWQLHLLYLHLLTVQAWYYLQRERQNFEDYATSCIFFSKKKTAIAQLAYSLITRYYVVLLPVPKSPLAENLTPSFVQQMTTDSPIWLRSRQILWNSAAGILTTQL